MNKFKVEEAVEEIVCKVELNEKVNWRPAHYLAALAWLSAFGSGWYVLLGRIQLNALAFTFFLFSSLVAFLASVMASYNPPKPKACKDCSECEASQKALVPKDKDGKAAK